MRTLFLKRPTMALFALAFWLCFASLPPGETRQLYLKLSGKATGATSLKINNSTLKQNGDGTSKVILDIGQTLTITDVVSTVTNIDIDTNGVTNIVIDTVTNTITNATADTISILLVDPQGNPISTFAEFDSIHGISTRESSERIFATGGGLDPIADVNGDITFDRATLEGAIQFTADGEPRSVEATMRANGDVDGNEFVFTGTVTANDPFVPAPTNFNHTGEAPLP